MSEKDTQHVPDDRSQDSQSHKSSGIENAAYNEVNEARSEQSSNIAQQNDQLGNANRELQNKGTLPNLNIDDITQRNNQTQQQHAPGNDADLMGKGKNTQPTEDASRNAMLNGFDIVDGSPNGVQSEQKTAKPPDADDSAKDPKSSKAECGRIDRSQFDRELKDPKVMAAFGGRMKTEVGGQGAAAQVAFAEEVMNRAASRDQTLMQALSGSYYPTSNPGSSTKPEFAAAINKAWKEGTDTTHGATGNGAAGFGKGGRETAKIGGESFGMEENDLKRYGWQKKYEKLKGKGC